MQMLPVRSWGEGGGAIECRMSCSAATFHLRPKRWTLDRRAGAGPSELTRGRGLGSAIACDEQRGQVGVKRPPFPLSRFT